MLPASASCSRKLDHNSASVSLLEAPFSINSVAKLGVLGVRSGVPGTRSFPGMFDVPGRASPACSRCSGSALDLGSDFDQKGATYHHSSLRELQSVARFGTSSGRIGLSRGNVGND